MATGNVAGGSDIQVAADAAAVAKAMNHQIDIAAAPEPDLTKMTDEERWRYHHQKMHEQHKGHEKMHLEMVLILFATMIIAQVRMALAICSSLFNTKIICNRIEKPPLQGQEAIVN